MAELSHLKMSLTKFAEKHFRLDYHQPSNTHIAYCMNIGRQGVKGFGHTADYAFDCFRKALECTILAAAEEELKYWEQRCVDETKAAKYRTEIERLCKTPLSLQIGMAVPNDVADWVHAEAKKQNLSRNEFVNRLLQTNLARLEERFEKEFTDDIAGEIRREIRLEAGKGEKAWSQHVSPELQAGLILMARRLNISVAMLARYLHVKGYAAAPPKQNTGRKRTLVHA